MRSLMRHNAVPRPPLEGGLMQTRNSLAVGTVTPAMPAMSDEVCFPMVPTWTPPRSPEVRPRKRPPCPRNPDCGRAGCPATCRRAASRWRTLRRAAPNKEFYSGLRIGLVRTTDIR
jgi:hypothetical protein